MVVKNPKREAIRLTKLWQEYGPAKYPVDLDILIEGAIQDSDFNGKLFVERGNFSTFEGCLRKTEGVNNWVIILNINVENIRRQRFTIAHEIGHFMCHRNLKTEFIDNHLSLNNFSDKLETEANLFAAWLLMPANIIESEFSREHWNTELLREIGNRFECSLQSAAIRFVDYVKRPIAFVASRDGKVLWTANTAAQ